MNFFSTYINLVWAGAMLTSLCSHDVPVSPHAGRVEAIRPNPDVGLYGRLISDRANSSFFERAGLRTDDLLLDMNLVAEEAFVLSVDDERITLYSGCRAHECDSRAYLAVNSRGRIVGAAVQAFNHCSAAARGPCSGRGPIVHLATRDVGPGLLRLLVEQVGNECRSSSTVVEVCYVYILQSPSGG